VGWKKKEVMKKVDSGTSGLVCKAVVVYYITIQYIDIYSTVKK